MTTRSWTPSAKATRIHIDVVDSDDHYPRLVVDSEVAVELSSAFRLYFPDLAAYDRWCEALDRHRADLGVQQTFGVEPEHHVACHFRQFGDMPCNCSELGEAS